MFSACRKNVGMTLTCNRYNVMKIMWRKIDRERWWDGGGAEEERERVKHQIINKQTDNKNKNQFGHGTWNREPDLNTAKENLRKQRRWEQEQFGEESYLCTFVCRADVKCLFAGDNPLLRVLAQVPGPYCGICSLSTAHNKTSHWLINSKHVCKHNSPTIIHLFKNYLFSSALDWKITLFNLIK